MELHVYFKLQVFFYTLTKALGQKFGIFSFPPRFIVSRNDCCTTNRVPASAILSESALLLSDAVAAKLLQSCPTLCDPKDSSPPGSPSLGFSRQEHWSGLPFPSSIQVVQSCPTSSDPMDCSPPGVSIHGILQARALEWVAIALSNLLSTSSYVSYTCDYIVIHAAFLSLFLIFLNPVCP